MKEDKLRIAGYLRISVDTELDSDNTSIENQRKIITDYVNKNFPNAQLDFYEDRDRSGYTFEQRENYQKMRPLLISGYYNILIIKDFSRFSRRNSKGLVELEDLRDVGVRIISIGDGIDYPTNNEWNGIQFRFLMNEMPVTDASRKVKTVIQSRQNIGKWISSVPYGYKMVNTKNMLFEVDENVADIVRKIYELYLQGWGYKKISNYLTEQGIPTPRMIEKERYEANGNVSRRTVKSEWSITSIQTILKNDFYIGTLRQGKYTRAKINGVDKRVDESEQKVFENNHTPIIDYRIFAKVQEQMKNRTRSNYRGIKKYDTTYSGFLYCGDCGSPMFSMSRPDLAPAYTCGTYHKRGRKGCTSHHTRTDMLDTMLKKYVQRVMDNSENMIKELEKAIKNEPKSLKKSMSTLDSLEAELARAKDEFKATQKQKIREMMKYEGNNELIEETYAELELELQNKIDGLENQIKMAEDSRNTTIKVNRVAKTAIEIFREILEKDKLDKGDLSLIIDRITVYEDSIEISLKSDIQSLLECGTMQNIVSENESANAVNFNWDIESISKARLVLKAQNQKDKAFDVNVIRSGDPLEIYTDNGGEVIFKKYSPIGEMGAAANQLADVIHKQSGQPVVILDRDHCVAAAGISKKEVLERRVSQQCEDIMESRLKYTSADGNDIVPLEGVSLRAQIISTVISSGDVSGAVVMLEGDKHADRSDEKMCCAAAAFLGMQMEDQ